MTSIGSSSAPPNVDKNAAQNPYAKILVNVNLSAFPEYTNLVGKVLAVFGCIHAFTMVICITILLIPIRRGPEVRQKLTWLLRKRYVSSISTPYHVMNSGLFVVITQLLSSLIFVAYVLLSYWSLNSKCFILRAYLHVCWELCLLPGYFGFHITAFSSLYTCLCSPKYAAKRRSVFAHPFFLNLLFYTLPIIVTIQAIAWSAALALAVISEDKAYKALVAYLQHAMETWSMGQSPNSFEHQQVIHLIGDYIIATQHFTKCWIWSSRTWSVMGLALAIFYTINVAGLLNLLRNSLKASQSPTQYGDNNVSVTVQQLGSEEGPESIHPSTMHVQATANASQNFSSTIQAQASTKWLRNGYVYLIVHCSIMLLDLLIHITCETIRTVHTERAVSDKTWRSRTTLLVLLGSTFASLAMLFHSWRIFTGREHTQIQESSAGTRFRNLLLSARDSPNSDAKNFNSERNAEQQMAEPSEMYNTSCNGIAITSNHPNKFWFNPIRLSSPSPFTALDEIDGEKLFEMPHIKSTEK